MAVQAGICISADGEREYRQALSNINQQTRELKSEMDLLTSSFDKNASAEEQGAAKAEVLQRQIDNQANKVALLTDKYAKEQSELERLKSEMERATAEYGANSEQAQKATAEYNKFATQTSKTKTELNKAQSDLNKLGKEMEEAQNPTKQEADALGEVEKSAKGAGEQGLKFGDVLKANVISDVIIGGVKALASAIRDIGKGLVNTVTDTVKWADDLATLSSTSGVSTERLQELEYMAGLVDVEVTTVTGSMTKLVKSMNTAADGTGEAAEAYAALGVEILDANGNLRDQNDVFNEVIDALGNIDNETQRDAYAMTILGKSARELNPLIEAGSDQLAAWADEAHNVGYVLDDETIGSMLDVQDALDRIQNAGDAARRKLVAAFAPTIAKNLERITPLLQGVGESVAELVTPAVDALASGLEKLKGWIDGLDESTKKQVAQFGLMAVALAPTIPLLSSAVNVVKSLASALTVTLNPATAVIGVLAAGMAAAAAAEALAGDAAYSAAANFDSLTDAQRDTLDASLNLADGINTAAEAQAEALNEMGASRDRALELVDALMDLAGADGVVEEADRNRAQVIIDELQSAYGIEIDMIDGRIQGYDNLRGSVQELIDAELAEALLERNRDAYLDALQNEQELTEGVALAQEELTATWMELTDKRLERDIWAYNHRDELEGRAGELAQQHAEDYLDTLDSTVEGLETAVSDAEGELDRLQTAYATNSRTISNYDAALVAAQQGDTSRVVDLMLNRENAWHDYGDAVDEETGHALDAMYEEVLAAAQYASDVRTNWENGVDGYTEDMVTEAENAFRGVLTAFDGAYTEATGIGDDFMSGLNDGLNGQLNRLRSTAESIAGVIPHGMRDILDMHSPSRVAAEIGQLFDEGLAVGLDRGSDMVATAAADQAGAMTGAFAGVSDVFGAGSMGAVVGRSSSVNYGGVSITVNASDEQTAQDIAELVMEQMENAVERKRAVFA